MPSLVWKGMFGRTHNVMHAVFYAGGSLTAVSNMVLCSLLMLLLQVLCQLCSSAVLEVFLSCQDSAHTSIQHW